MLRGSLTQPGDMTLQQHRLGKRVHIIKCLVMKQKNKYLVSPIKQHIESTGESRRRKQTLLVQCPRMSTTVHLVGDVLTISGPRAIMGEVKGYLAIGRLAFLRLFLLSVVGYFCCFQ